MATSNLLACRLAPYVKYAVGLSVNAVGESCDRNSAVDHSRNGGVVSELFMYFAIFVR